MYFYDCGGSDKLNFTHFSSIINSLQNNKDFKKYINKNVGINGIVNHSNWITDSDASTFYLKFNQTDVSLVIAHDYWLIDYNFDIPDINLGNELNKASIQTSQDREWVDTFVYRNIINRHYCSSRLGAEISNVYSSNVAIECLQKEKDFSECLNDSNYDVLLQKLSITKTKENVDNKYPLPNQKIVLDKFPLNQYDIKNSLTRMVVVSDEPIIIGGGFKYSIYDDQIRFLMNLRKMQDILIELSNLNRKCSGFLNISQNKLDELRKFKTLDKFFYWLGNKELQLSNISNQVDNCKNELVYFSGIPNIIKRDLELNEDFYINFYKKFAISNLEQYSESLQVINNNINRLQLNIESIKEINSNKRESSLALFIALIAIVLPIIFGYKGEKKNSDRFRYFQNKLNEISTKLGKSKK